jgi:hypothetical protein
MIGRLTTLLVPVALGAAGCPSVDCEALCQRTLACEVTFAPSDDPDELKVDTGERTALQSCALGCEESPTVTVESASCIDELEITGDPAQCQPGVVDCLGLSEALAGDDTSGGLG